LQPFLKSQLQQVESFVAVEARGFVLAIIGTTITKGLLLVRKAGKLPPPVECVGYSLEYGSDQLEMSAQIEAQKVILVDDVLATGGTLKAVNQLCQNVDIRSWVLSFYGFARSSCGFRFISLACAG
jgi:adenine phosphoribosyltransferase